MLRETEAHNVEERTETLQCNERDAEPRVEDEALMAICAFRASNVGLVRGVQPRR